MNNNIVRPFLVTLRSSLELDFLTYDEFAYFIPLINDGENAKEIIESIRLYRDNKATLRRCDIQKVDCYGELPRGIFRIY